MRDVVICVVAADARLQLQTVGDGIVELPTFGVPVVDDLQSPRMGSMRVFRVANLCFQEVGEVAQLAGVV
ncbi:hypothetical protein ACH4Y0_08190 [Streptomyces sp. NPDC020707]|uniref:hypothetical protein n=1 Tax=Streptomyces sp. NPDC020707 TaxID=3365084 RepID=UPI0037A16F31